MRRYERPEVSVAGGSILLHSCAMQTMFPMNVVNRLTASSVEWTTYTSKDWLLVAASILLLLAYEGIYLAIYHYAPHRCTLHRNIQCRKYVSISLKLLRRNLADCTLCERRWVEGLLRKKGAEVLVVQSLRNGILAANFFAGASSTIALFILGYVHSIGELWAPELDISASLLLSLFTLFIFASSASFKL